MSPRDLRRQAAGLLRLAAQLQCASDRNVEASATLATKASRQMAAARVAIDMARRQLAK